MPRVEVPDAFELDYIPVAGTPPDADGERIGAPRNEVIRVSERYPRNLKVREDDDGTRYVGAKAETAAKLRAYFAEEFDIEYDTDEEAESGDESDSDDTEGDASSDDTDGEDAPTAAEQIDAGVCPWCNDYEGDGVAQHASAVHPDEWADYKED